MNLRNRASVLWQLLAVAALGTLATGCQLITPASRSLAPAPAYADPLYATSVWTGSYAQHIQPVFDRSCVKCHSKENPANGLDLSNYEGVMRGTQYGTVVMPGYPSASTLLFVLEGKADPSIRMPRRGRKLGDQELANLQAWIKAGAHKD